MVCPAVDVTNLGITEFMKYPSYCNYWFYLMLTEAIWVIIAMILYRRDSEKSFRPDFLSCAGVSSIAIIVIDLILTALNLMDSTLFIYGFVINLIVIVLWLFKD